MTYRFVTALAAILVAVGIAGGAFAATYEEGDAAYEKKDFAGALAIYRPLAAAGDVRAQFSIGYMYANGQGVPVDYVEAVRWYRMASDLGNPTAMVNLALKYELGQGVDRDPVQALKWYEIAFGRYGLEDAMQAQDRVQHNIDLIAARMTRDQIDEAGRQADLWKPPAK